MEITFLFFIINQYNVLYKYQTLFSVLPCNYNLQWITVCQNKSNLMATKDMPNFGNPCESESNMSNIIQIQITELTSEFKNIVQIKLKILVQCKFTIKSTTFHY